MHLENSDQSVTCYLEKVCKYCDWLTKKCFWILLPYCYHPCKNDTQIFICDVIMFILIYHHLKQPIIAEVEILLNVRYNFFRNPFNAYPDKDNQDRCHQWSTRPDPQSRSLFSVVFCFARFEKWGRTDGRTNERTDNMCKNSDDHYRPWLWVGRVDQLLWIRYIFGPILRSTRLRP